MASLTYPISFTVGSPLIRRWTWKTSSGVPYDLATWGALLHVRERLDSTKIIVNLSSSITLGDGQDNIVIDFTPSPLLKPFSAFYHLRLIDPAGVLQEPLVGGPFIYAGAYTK